MRDRIGSLRPRKGTVVLVVGAVAIGAGGVGWAATRAASPGVITACADAASHQLFLSSDGTCAGGQTVVQWNQQGPQGLEGPQGQTGPQGPQGAAAPSSGVVAFGPQSYKTGFSMSTEIDKPGAYVADGSVGVTITPNKPHAKFVAACSLFTGPPNGTATRVALWVLKFIYNKKTKTFKPSSASGPVDVNSGLSLGTGDLPLAVYYTCHSYFSVWTHPALTIEAATNSSFHTVVGAALPNQPKIGPGPIGKVLGTGSGQTH